MNPYVSFGLAMCAVIAISLFLTAYMAVMFNRRAKADLLSLLTPLAEIIEGDVNLEEARVTGRFRGQIAEGRAANSPDGPGRVFLTSIIDGAGGSPWTYTFRRPKNPDSVPVTTFDGPAGTVGDRIERILDELAPPLLNSPGWLRVAYDPGPGHVLLTRPMLTRRDVPEPDAFETKLDALVELGQANRSIQQPAE